MDSQFHCACCFEVLTAHLEGREPLSLDDLQSYWEEFSEPADDNSEEEPGATKSTEFEARRFLNADEEFPLFVTWKTKGPGSSRRLRGCKGTFRALPLAEGLAEFALISALEDYRFEPIQIDELPALSCDVTLLHSFEPCDNMLDWEVGTHGIRIAFADKGVKHGATFLPDVMVEQGWNKKDAIISAVKKSGSAALSKAERGDEDKWAVVERLNVRVTRYQGRKTHMKYAEWATWKSWADDRANWSEEDEGGSDNGTSQVDDGENDADRRPR